MSMASNPSFHDPSFLPFFRCLSYAFSFEAVHSVLDHGECSQSDLYTMVYGRSQS